MSQKVALATAVIETQNAAALSPPAILRACAASNEVGEAEDLGREMKGKLGQIMPVKYADGYIGKAKLAKDPYGYRVTASGPSQVVLKKLKESLTSGIVKVAWKMKPVKAADATRNGFIVLSSDEDANAAICAGSWIASNKITLFENKSKWGQDLHRVCMSSSQEFNCELVINIDLRTASLTVDGETLNMSFTETITSVNYIGFGVHEKADAIFTVPSIHFGK